MSMRVLVADDSRTMRKILVRMLQKLEVDETIEAVDGNHALVLFELNEFDLVVTDWMMPGMSGLDLLKHIRGKGSETPVVMLTTVADREQILSAINAGASEYLLKPFNSQQQDKLISLCRKVQDHSYTPRRRTSINVQYINPFITATMDVLSNMLNCQLTRGEIFVKNNQQPMYDISSVIELSGKAQGTAVLSISRKAALRAADEMLPNKSNSFDENIVDLVGELTNIIVGNAQKDLLHYDMQLSPPKVITGRSHCIDFPKGVMPLCVPFQSEWGPMSLEVGFCEKSADELEDLFVA